MQALPTRHFFPVEVPEFLYYTGVIYLFVLENFVNNIWFKKKIFYLHILMYLSCVVSLHCEVNRKSLCCFTGSKPASFSRTLSLH